MKKYFFIFLLLCSGYAIADSVPQWSEFCPAKYLNATQVKNDKEQSYWYWRRIRFETALDKCSALSGSELSDCYENLRKAEEAKNNKTVVIPNKYNEARERVREQAGVYNENTPMYMGIGTLINSMIEEQ